MFVSAFYCGFPFLVTQKRQFGEQLYLPYLSCFEVIGTQAQGQTQSNPIFHSDKNSLLGLGSGFMKSPQCSIALNVLSVLVYREQADILNLIIDFDYKVEDCAHPLMLNINALEIQYMFHSDKKQIWGQKKVQTVDSFPD